MRILTALDRVAIWHEAAFPVEPHYEVGMHEVGHALDDMGDNRASSSAESALRDFYSQQHPDQHGAWTESDYNQWLRTQFPQEMFQGGQDFNQEAVAQAFADVELGANPSEAAKMLHQMVVEESQEQTSKLLEGPGWQTRYLHEHQIPYVKDRPTVRPVPARTRYIPYEQAFGKGKIKVPKGFAQAIKDMKVKYPHLDIGSVRVDLPPTNLSTAIAWTGREPADHRHVVWHPWYRPTMGFDIGLVDPEAMARTQQHKVDTGWLNPWYNDPDTGPMPEQETQHLMEEFGP